MKRTIIVSEVTVKIMFVPYVMRKSTDEEVHARNVQRVINVMVGKKHPVILGLGLHLVMEFAALVQKIITATVIRKMNVPKK